jgi:hypothetical protein
VGQGECTLPSKKYVLEPGGRERLTVCWRGAWKRLTVWLDGREVGTVADRRALRAGQSFPLEDGTTLHVQLVQNFISPELRLLRDGRPLPGSPFDPAERLHIAYATVFLLAGLHLAFGVAAEIYGSDYLAHWVFGAGSLVLGSLFLVMGFFVRRRSALALTAAMILYAVEALSSLILTAALQCGLPTGGLVIHFFFLAGMYRFLAGMYRGLPAIRGLNRAEQR